MHDFFFVELNSAFALPVPAAANADLALEPLCTYIQDGGGPVPGQPEWRFTVDWQEQSGFYVIEHSLHEEKIAAIGGIALGETAANEMWEALERLRLKLYQALAKAYGHKLPDLCLGNASQPSTLPWVGSLLLAPYMANDHEESAWLMPFQLQLATALIHLKK